MTTLPQSLPCTALFLCLSLAACGKTDAPAVPAGPAASPGYDTGSAAEPPAPSPTAGQSSAPALPPRAASGAAP